MRSREVGFTTLNVVDHLVLVSSPDMWCGMRINFIWTVSLYAFNSHAQHHVCLWPVVLVLAGDFERVHCERRVTG